MEKQPDKLEVLMDWFLGDAKEITATQKEMTQKLSELSEKAGKRHRKFRRDGRLF
ncbi:hypothetical protein [Klebsiella variicola]|uniref:Uncharacterized protein n=1 Tax=Klebsiella variicola TaxID=244366 RepID=A0A9Q9P1Y6_KLEVA|nr:hypothetical protein [Klebsiella variicola]UYA93107.1 hypothetical protein KKR95_p00265 [Klebsiella variicola]